MVWTKPPYTVLNKLSRYYYYYTKENLKRNISNYPLNSKSVHNLWYLSFYLKIIYNQPTVKKPSLNEEDLSNYRHIVNHSSISKLIPKNCQKASSQPFNLYRLSTWFGIFLLSLQWWTSYLSSHTSAIAIPLQISPSAENTPAPSGVGFMGLYKDFTFFFYFWYISASGYIAP